MSQGLILYHANPSLQKCRSLRSINIDKNLTKITSNPKPSPKVQLLQKKSKYLLNQIDNVERV